MIQQKNKLTHALVCGTRNGKYDLFQESLTTERVKQLDGLPRDQALTVVQFVHIEIGLDSKVLFSPTC